MEITEQKIVDILTPNLGSEDGKKTFEGIVEGLNEKTDDDEEEVGIRERMRLVRTLRRMYREEKVDCLSPLLSRDRQSRWFLCGTYMPTAETGEEDDE